MSLLTIPTFTNLGYRLHSRQFRPITTDMRGKVVVITGGTGGLGSAAARALAGLGARVVVVGRDLDKLRAVEARIEGSVGYLADLSLLADIRRLADRLLDGEPTVDVLINNVGVLLPEREVTAEGLEMTFAVDLAGQFLLTNLLLPRMTEGAPARVVNVTSGGMYSERIRPDDLQFQAREYKGAAAYAHAKRGQVILTEMWADRLDGTGVTVHAMHPGWAATPGVSESLPTFNRLMGPLLRTPEQGADTIVWLAADPEPDATSGELWFDRGIVPKHLVDRTRESEPERLELWRRLAELTGSDVELTQRR
jgi:NAD(P)-dependent dehydrogenase (short-subunit alcohol dehydrogenase family)